MILYKNIKHVHLELSTFCNARCPLCPRNFHGYPYNDGYTETNMTLTQAKIIFSIDFLTQLKTMILSGNLGDALMNPHTVSILEYFRSANPNLEITLDTNGSGRNKKFWQDLAKLGIKIRFALDGLNDTHHLYRQDTDFNKIIANAKIVIDSGGCAIWKLVPFAHNQHQIEECRSLALELGFEEFIIHNENRNTGPVYDKKGNLVHVMGNYNGIVEFKTLLKAKQTDLVLVEDVVADQLPKKEIKCKAQQDSAVYISATGEVSPCCWMGFYPKTYGHGEYHQAVNSQIADIVYKNNALEYPLEECISWFTNIKQAWTKTTYSQGRLIACDDNCGIA